MRWAFVSDIHGNLPAWNTVLADCAVRGVDRIVCLGDTVGYGPQPAECLRSVWQRCHAIVLGNHDAVAAGMLDESAFNDRAARSARWTRSRLSSKAAAAFSSLPLSLRGSLWRAAHGGFRDPAAFSYVFSPEDAAESFAAASEQLLLCGHTHEAALFVVGASGRVHKIAPQDFELEEGKRYLVNVGSAGSPRDGDPRASYVVFDDAARTVVFVRVPFDFEAYRQAVSAADGLDAADVPLLRAAAVRETPDSVREAPDFSPSKERRVEGAAAVADAATGLRRDNARLRTFLRVAAALAAAAAAVAAIATAAVIRSQPHDEHFPAPGMAIPPVALGERVGDDGNALPPIEPGVAADTGRFLCLPYSASLADGRRQTIQANSSGHVDISSAAPLAASFSSPLVEVRPGMRIESMARAKFSPDFRGTFQLRAVVQLEDGSEKELFRRDFSSAPVGVSESAMPVRIRALRRADGWQLARGTTGALPEGASFVRLDVAGSFAGQVTVGAISARRRK